MNDIYPWQNQEWQNLINAKNSGRLPHAILIKGIEGLGKFHFARLFAEMLLCVKGLDQACGECRSCQLLKANNHPDLIIIQPEEQGEIIKIDQIRGVITELNNTSVQGVCKIVIIDGAELLNRAAANALLKVLEEPATNVYIILVSSLAEAISATIRSRCQTITMKTPSVLVGEAWLKSKSLDVDFKLALALAQHAPLKALDLINDDSLSKRQEFFQYLYSFSNNKISVMQLTEQCLAWDLKFFIMTFIYIVGDIIHIKLKAQENVINQDQIKEFVKLSNNVGLSNLFAFQDLLIKCHENLVANINLNQQLVIENILTSWIQLFAK